MEKDTDGIKNKQKIMKRALISGSSGLLGSETVRYLCKLGWKVYGIDNNMRGKMFGEEASTLPERDKLVNEFPGLFIPLTADIRNPEQMENIFYEYGPFDFIIHAAAQPAHEWSTNNALADFQINAYGTLIMLECYRQYSPEAVFIQVSSSKVYGDSVNELPLRVYTKRYDLPKHNKYYEGVDENFGRLDGNLHSLFGASKACGDIMAHEYGTYFKLPIVIFRPVCVTGPAHKGAAIHGYLSYLVKCVGTGTEYTINGYDGKQVRDNIHSYDLIDAFYKVYEHRERIRPGEQYNIGAGRKSNNSILEAIEQAEKILGVKAKVKYSDISRRGDHRWCIYNTTKFRKDFPEWEITYDNDRIMNELCDLYREL